MGKPFVSLLDGEFASEWAELAPGQHASQRATTSSRTPGKVNRGTVYARTFAHGELHIHTCGLKMTQCARCEDWICEAAGHLKHVCPEVVR